MGKEELFSLYQRIIQYIPFGYRPPPLRITYQITSKCNLKCKMCPGMDGSKDDLSLEKVKEVINKIKEVFAYYPFHPSIGIQGGEPLLREDALDIIDSVTKSGLNCALITNGTLLNKEIARRLCANRLYSISFSLDGLKDYNDYMRGEGTFKKTVEAIKQFCDMDSSNQVLKNINTVVSVKNIATIDRFIAIFRGYNVTHTLMPIIKYKSCGSPEMEGLEIGSERFFYEKLKELVNKNSGYEKKIYTRYLDKTYTRVGVVDASVNKCSAIHWRCNIYPDGYAQVCSKMPKMDLMSNSLMNIFNHSNIRAQRKKTCKESIVDKFCNECDRLHGCKALRLDRLLKNRFISGKHI